MRKSADRCPILAKAGSDFSRAKPSFAHTLKRFQCFPAAAIAFAHSLGLKLCSCKAAGNSRKGNIHVFGWQGHDKRPQRPREPLSIMAFKTAVCQPWEASKTYVQHRRNIAQHRANMCRACLNMSWAGDNLPQLRLKSYFLSPR